MKRALFLLALVLLPQVAEAKIAVVRPRSRSETSLTQGSYLTQLGDYAFFNNFAMAHVTGFMNRYGRKLGTDYDIYTPEQVQTSLAGQGLIRGKQYTAVVWAGEESYNAAQNPHAGCYPCSLTLVAYAPSVPQLFIGNGEQENLFFQSTGCSLRVHAALDPDSQGPDYGTGVVYSPTDPSVRWHRAWDVGQMLHATLPDGGVRYIMGVNWNRDAKVNRDTTTGVDFAIQNWSISAGADTTGGFIAWHILARLNQHKHGMAQTIFVHYGTSQATRIAGSGAAGNEEEHLIYDPFPVYASLAYLDSLVGGDLIGASPTPVRFAIQIEGVASRGPATSDGGLLAADSTVAYASLDSLNRLGVPVAFGVNIDSVCCYPRDLIVAKTVRNARFTFFGRDCIADTSTSANGGRADSLTQRDVWGRFRMRPYSIYANATVDTTLRKLIAVQNDRLRVLVGDRISSVAMFPDEDWSPKNITYRQGSFDSVVFNARAAGMTAFAINVEADTLNTTGSTNPVGLRADPMFRKDIIGGSGYLGLIGYTRINGNKGAGTAAWQSTGHAVEGGMALRKLWMSAYTGMWLSPVKVGTERTGTYSDWSAPFAKFIGPGGEAWVSPLANTNRPVNILRASMAGMCSGTADRTGPTRPAYWTIKSLVHQVGAINALAGRNIAQIVYPDDLQPTDLR